MLKLAETTSRGGFALFAGTTFSTFISSIGVIIIARLLGPADYGIYSLVLTIPSFAVALAGFGINAALTRYSAKYKVEACYSKICSMMKCGLIFKLISAVAMFSIVMGTSQFIAFHVLSRPETVSYLKLASVIILVQAILSSISSTLYGLDEMGEASFLIILKSIVKSLFSPLLIILGLSILGALLGSILSFVSSTILGLAFFFNHYRKLQRKKSEDSKSMGVLPVMLRYGFPLYLANLMPMLLMPYQNLVLARFVSNIEIGNYNASVNFMAIVQIISIPITLVLFPAFSKLDLNRELYNLKQLFRLTVKYTSLLIVPISIAVMIFSRELVYIIYGSQYLTAPLYLSVRIGLFFLTGLGHLVIQGLFKGIGDTKETLKMAIVTTIVFIPSIPLMAKTFQVLGVIVALISSTLVSDIYGLYRAKRKYNLSLDVKGLSGIYVASGLSAILAIIAIQGINSQPIINLAVVAPLFLVIYLTAAPILGAIDQTDINNLIKISNSNKLVKTIAKYILTYESWLIKSKKNLNNLLRAR